MRRRESQNDLLNLTQLGVDIINMFWILVNKKKLLQLNQLIQDKSVIGQQNVGVHEIQHLHQRNRRTLGIKSDGRQVFD